MLASKQYISVITKLFFSSVGTASLGQGHQVNDFGRVGSGHAWVSVTDPFCDAVFVVLHRLYFCNWGENTPLIFVYSVFSLS